MIEYDMNMEIQLRLDYLENLTKDFLDPIILSMLPSAILIMGPEHFIEIFDVHFPEWKQDNCILNARVIM